jgi:hypothetical protein
MEKKTESENKPLEIVEVVPSEVAIKKFAPLFAETTPKETLQKAQEMAGALMEVIETSKKKLIVNIQGRDFMIYEGWQFLGAVSNMVVSTDEPTEMVNKEGDVIGYRCKAKVLHYRSGEELSTASAIITRNERGMADVPAFQLYSKVQTRAGSKALRMILSHIVVLAGVEPTPAEEMESSMGYQSKDIVVEKNKSLIPKQQKDLPLR